MKKLLIFIISICLILIGIFIYIIFFKEVVYSTQNEQELSKKLNDLETIVENLKSNENDFSKLEKKVTEYEIKISELETKLDTYETKFSDLDNNIINLKDTTTNNSNLEKRLYVNETKISNLNISLNDLNNYISSQNQTILDLQNQISNLNKKAKNKTIGTWKGMNGEKAITMTFNEDGTLIFNNFSGYMYNDSMIFHGNSIMFYNLINENTITIYYKAPSSLNYSFYVYSLTRSY